MTLIHDLNRAGRTLFETSARKLDSYAFPELAIGTLLIIIIAQMCSIIADRMTRSVVRYRFKVETALKDRCLIGN